MKKWATPRCAVWNGAGSSEDYCLGTGAWGTAQSGKVESVGQWWKVPAWLEPMHQPRQMTRRIVPIPKAIVVICAIRAEGRFVVDAVYVAKDKLLARTLQCQQRKNWL
jgi:hypothetical protein